MSATTETVGIKHLVSGAGLFSCEVEAGLLAGANLGAAVRLAVKADARLDGANLAGANLAGANLDGANLAGARLDDARLAGANLAGANLDGANLAGANLAGARLDGANLDGANLAGANLAGANLAGAFGILDCGSPYGWRVGVVKHEDGIRIAAGCRWFKYRAAVDHWASRADRKLMPPLLAYIKAAVKINGWKLEG